jgi:hypothetical protein
MRRKERQNRNKVNNYSMINVRQAVVQVNKTLFNILTCRGEAQRGEVTEVTEVARKK